MSRFYIFRFSPSTIPQIRFDILVILTLIIFRTSLINFKCIKIFNALINYIISIININLQSVLRFQDKLRQLPSDAILKIVGIVVKEILFCLVRAYRLKIFNLVLLKDVWSILHGV